MAKSIWTSYDFQRNEIRQAVVQVLGSDPATITSSEGQIYYNSVSKTVKRYDGTAWADIGPSGTGLANAYTSVSDGTNSTSTSGASTLRFVAAGSNLLTIVVADAAPDTVTFTVNASPTPGANKIPQADGSNKLAAGWISEVLALADLSDVTTKTGSGTSVVMAQLPTFVASGGVSLDAGSGRIQNLADPTNGTDAATKQYVDATKTGLDFKQSVRAASTANVSVTYTATGGTSARGQITAVTNSLDGVTLANGDRVLLKNQTTGAQNGIWSVTTVGTGANGVWDRATDFDSDAEVTAGAFVWVTEGTVNADVGYVLTTNDAITIGGASGTALTFTQFSAANSYSFQNVGTSGVGTYDSISGQVVSLRKVNAASTKLSVTLNGQQIDIDAVEANFNHANIGGTTAVANGGTGQTTAAGARGTSGLGNATAPANATNVVATNGGIPLKRTFAITAPGSVSAFVCTHNLGTTDVVVSIRDASDNAVDAEWVATNSNTVTVSFFPAPANTTAFKVTIIG